MFVIQRAEAAVSTEWKWEADYFTINAVLLANNKKRSARKDKRVKKRFFLTSNFNKTLCQLQNVSEMETTRRNQLITS